MAPIKVFLGTDMFCHSYKCMQSDSRTLQLKNNEYGSQAVSFCGPFISIRPNESFFRSVALFQEVRHQNLLRSIFCQHQSLSAWLYTPYKMLFEIFWEIVKNISKERHRLHKFCTWGTGCTIFCTLDKIENRQKDWRFLMIDDRCLSVDSDVSWLMKNVSWLMTDVSWLTTDVSWSSWLTTDVSR